MGVTKVRETLDSERRRVRKRTRKLIVIVVCGMMARDITKATELGGGLV